MNAKIAQFINKGMRQDLSIDKVSNEYAFENVNIRITENEDNTLLSVTNELGNSRLDIENPHADETPWYNEDFPSDVYRDTLAIPGNLIGSCVIAENLVLFFTNVTENYPDAIIRIYKEGESLTWKLLYCGHLNFSTEHPIETLGDYESESSIKVYWVDGHNQARFINIVADDTKVAAYTDTSFDFLPTINEFPNIFIERLDNTIGRFPSGVIQYAFTYSNLNGQESAVFYTSMLQYIMFNNRAGSPDEIVDCSFKISISNIDRSFDRLNIYSIYRASYNGTPITKRIASVDLSLIQGSKVNYVDNNYIGEVIDNTELFYKGGDYVIAGTLDQKDSVLFMGDLKIQRPKVTDTLLNKVTYSINTANDREIPDIYSTDYFPYSPQSNALNTYKYLKATDYYRIGYQLQDKYGKWSAPIYLEDYKHSLRPTHYDEPVTTLNLTFDSSFDTSLYKRVRAVIVFPDKNNRICISQGVVNPTVFRLKDRYQNKPYAVASWFFRPYPNATEQAEDSFLEYRNARLIKDASSLFGEIQSQDNLGSVAQTDLHNSSVKLFNRKYALIYDYDRESRVWCPMHTYTLKDSTYSGTAIDKAIYEEHKDIVTFGVAESPYFAVDTNLITFNSPDIEELTQDSIVAKFRIVGVIGIDKGYGLFNLKTEVGPWTESPSGFYDYRHTKASHLSSYPSWIDFKVSDSNSTRNGYLLYPWSKEGSLTFPNLTSNDYGLLSRKILSNTLYSEWTNYFQDEQDLENATYPNISEIKIYDPDKAQMLAIKNPDSYNVINKNIVAKDFYYYGELNTLCTPCFDSYLVYGQAIYNNVSNRPEFGTYDELVNAEDKIIYPLENIYTASGLQPFITAQEFPSSSNSAYSTNPVSLKFKSTKHAVFSLGFIENNSYKASIVLPRTDILDSQDTEGTNFSNWGFEESAIGYPFWMNPIDDSSIRKYNLSRYMFDTFQVQHELPNGEWLFIGELYRDNTPESIFGGTSEFELSQNNWIPASEPDTIVKNQVSKLYIVGDTMYQRWDCLKTYAYTDEDTNSITETLSFMVESQVNLDGRYDKNRGRTDNTSSSPENVNLFNDVYNQENNYFNYRIFEDFYYTNTKFPNQFTWSLPKSPNSEVDNWTNITLSSVYNVDGSLGKINKIKRFRDVLFGFQDKGIFQILFNSRSQIATTTGVPIELANSGKVDGVRYLSTMEGCQNKWTICETPNGLYFIDDTNHSINRFSGENLEHLSTDKGFDRYMRNEGNIWQRTFYDRNLKDVYFVSDKTCLAFSEKLNEFMSFYPGYQKTPLMCNLYDNFIAIDNSQDDYYIAYKNHTADNYSAFFDKDYDYSITYRVAQEPYLDKIFTNIEYDAEIRQNNNDLPESFSKLETQTDYQKGSIDLTFPNLIRKFRKWRANIPRDKTHLMDRMRGPWMTLKLTKYSSPDNKNKQMEFHNLLVKYFV